MPGGQIIRFIRDASGVRVAYAIVGEGPLILCPAWWVSHLERDWEHPGFRQFFSRLADGFRIVRYDRPGTGLSDRDVRDVPPRTQAAEVALLARLADAFGDPQLALFAISCAGPVALTYAAAHQDRIRRLCLYGSYAHGADIATPELWNALADLVEAHWGVGADALTARMLPGASPEDFEAFSRDQRDWASAQKAAELLRLSRTLSALDALHKVRTETLIIHRREDQAIPLEVGRRLAAELPHARLTVVDGRVHLPWIDGDSIAEVVRSFLTGREAPASGAPPTVAPACRLDEANRALILRRRRVPTTRLEYDVMRALIRGNGRVLTRDEMLTEIWNTPYAGSNKVDAVIRLLRKKLGAFAASIETATGHGYRFAGWKRVPQRRSERIGKQRPGLRSTREGPSPPSDRGAE
jgi:pimeloyl-ACP methyl ester carboxylesterase/DNA-binding winged helix-turn-helix (wHTH) protein